MASSLPKLPVFEALARHDPDSTAIIHSDSQRRFTYSRLLRDVAQERERLLQLTERIGYGQRIAFFAENSYTYVVSLLSILGAHAIALPLSPNFPVKELQYILDQSQASLLLASDNFQSKAEEILDTEYKTNIRLVLTPEKTASPTNEKVVLEKSRSEEGGLILYTSGTTAQPKGVLHSQSVLTAQAISLIKAWEYTQKDHLLHVLPLHHIHGLMNALIAPLFAGSTIEFLFPFNPIAVWERMAAPYLPSPRTLEKITILSVVPTIYNRLLSVISQLPVETQDAAKKGISPTNLRLNMSGSAALPTPTKRAWTDLSGGNVLLERYGMTEIGMALSCGLAFRDRVDGSVGWPLPSVEVRLVDTETNEVIALGEEMGKDGKERDGEIQVRGPTIFTGYFRNENATKKEHVESEDGGRIWFKTGDIAVRRYVDTAGHSSQEWAQGPMYFIRGRKSADIIKSGGEKVSALEVERELLSLPQIAEAAVVGVPSTAWGQKLGAVIVLRRDALEKEGSFSPMSMRRALRDRLARYKIPRVMRIVEQIPRNAMGKVNKKELVHNLFVDDVSGEEY
ncbi:Malonate--CoA ligase [Podosphaera aphanis]|nr:Malonate--CoA ligase [Podosphaera aphanis]